MPTLDVPLPPPPSSAFDAYGMVTLPVLHPSVAELARSEFPPPEGGGWHTFTRPLEFGKQEGSATIAGPCVAEIHRWLASEPLVVWLEALSGIGGLRADPERVGSGIHQNGPGSRLGLHTDFNVHPQDRNLIRAVNVIVFLDDGPLDYEDGGWFEMQIPDQDGYGGTRWRPRAGHMVVFPSDDRHYHGHPVPIREGGGLRRSIPAYYFRPRRHDEFVLGHSTRFLDEQ